MSLIDRLLPSPADNRLRGPVFTWYVFVLLAIVMGVRSLVHLLASDAGLNSIATLIVFDAAADAPDPNRAIYLFGSLWGLHQAILAGLYLLVAARYRSLVPLMYATLVVEWAGRLCIGAFLQPLGDAYFLETAPGATAAIPMLLVSSAMLVVSLRTPSSRPSSETVGA